MKKLSLDNGLTFKTMDEVNSKEIDLINKSWDQILNLMDDKIREFTHNESHYIEGINISFLDAYLRNAHNDLILG